MKKTEYNFIDDETKKAACRAGETFRRGVLFQDKHKNLVPLTGWTARMQARVNYDSETPLFTLTTENGGITVTDIGGLQLYIAADVTEGFAKGKYKYDLELIHPNGDIGSPVYGVFQVTPEITR